MSCVQIMDCPPGGDRTQIYTSEWKEKGGEGVEIEGRWWTMFSIHRLVSKEARADAGVSNTSCSP
jgi:hypothetical protein